MQVALKRAAVQVGRGEPDGGGGEGPQPGGPWPVSQRWKIQFASQQVKNQIALLQGPRRHPATPGKPRSTEARADYERAQQLVPSGAIAKEEFDQRQEQFRVAEADVTQAPRGYLSGPRDARVASRAGRGQGFHRRADRTSTETFSDVRSAFSDLVQTMTQLGLPLASTECNAQQSHRQIPGIDHEGNLDRILRDLIPKVPAVLQAKAQLAQARHDLEQAELNLRYCDVVSEIDGVVTSRNVNPGNNVQAGQSLMAVRSVHGDLDRRQFQRDAAGGAAHRPAGARSRWTCTAAAKSSRGASPASRWAPVRRWPCCRRRTPPATSSRSSSGCRSASS